LTKVGISANKIPTIKKATDVNPWDIEMIAWKFNFFSKSFNVLNCMCINVLIVWAY